MEQDCQDGRWLQVALVRLFARINPATGRETHAHAADSTGGGPTLIGYSIQGAFKYGWYEVRLRLPWK